MAEGSKPKSEPERFTGPQDVAPITIPPPHENLGTDEENKPVTTDSKKESKEKTKEFSAGKVR